MEGRGGAWTIKKLERVAEYLARYQDVMLKQDWAETIYVDAFCGSGSYKLRGARDFTEGSAIRAVELSRPFSQYCFIEKSSASLSKLEQLIQQRNSKATVHYHVGDVNEILPRVVNSLTSRQRAVVFADPYGMQLNWSTVQSVARTPRCDFWLLVPTMALLRVATRDPRRRATSWDKRIDAFMGEGDWRTRWYEATGQRNFFDNGEEIMRTAKVDQIAADFRGRLEREFPPGGVAKNVLHLRDLGNRVLFTLMFACSNPSPSAQRISINIANWLLKD